MTRPTAILPSAGEIVDGTVFEIRLVIVIIAIVVVVVVIGKWIRTGTVKCHSRQRGGRIDFEGFELG